MEKKESGSARRSGAGEGSKKGVLVEGGPFRISWHESMFMYKLRGEGVISKVWWRCLITEHILKTKKVNCQNVKRQDVFSSLFRFM